MAKLLYITNTSLDGYIEDAAGDFSFIRPPDEVLPFITELVRPVGTHLYGRRLYETMAYWEAPAEGSSPEDLEWAHVWQQAQKIVFSRTLANVTARNTRIERNFDPEMIAKLKRESKPDIIIGGAELAALAIAADLVDECALFVNPSFVGGGKPAFRSGLRRDLELLETRRFDTGVVYVRYGIRGSLASSNVT